LPERVGTVDLIGRYAVPEGENVGRGFTPRSTGQQRRTYRGILRRTRLRRARKPSPTRTMMRGRYRAVGDRCFAPSLYRLGCWQRWDGGFGLRFGFRGCL